MKSAKGSVVAVLAIALILGAAAISGMSTSAPAYAQTLKGSNAYGTGEMPANQTPRPAISDRDQPKQVTLPRASEEPKQLSTGTKCNNSGGSAC